MNPPYTTPEGVRLPHAPASWPFGAVAAATLLPTTPPQAWPQRAARVIRRAIDTKNLPDAPF